MNVSTINSALEAYRGAMLETAHDESVAAVERRRVSFEELISSTGIGSVERVQQFLGLPRATFFRLKRGLEPMEETWSKLEGNLRARLETRDDLEGTRKTLSGSGQPLKPLVLRSAGVVQSENQSHGTSLSTIAEEMENALFSEVVKHGIPVDNAEGVGIAGLLSITALSVLPVLSLFPFYHIDARQNLWDIAAYGRCAAIGLVIHKRHPGYELWCEERQKVKLPNVSPEGEELSAYQDLNINHPSEHKRLLWSEDWLKNVLLGKYIRLAQYTKLVSDRYASEYENRSVPCKIYSFSGYVQADIAVELLVSTGASLDELTNVYYAMTPPSSDHAFTSTLERFGLSNCDDVFSVLVFDLIEESRVLASLNRDAYDVVRVPFSMVDVPVGIGYTKLATSWMKNSKIDGLSMEDRLKKAALAFGGSNRDRLMRAGIEVINEAT